MDAADPEGLLKTGAPSDEYEPEIDRITARVHSLTTPTVEAIETVIYNVWNEMFGPIADTYESAYRASFRPVAVALMAEIQREVQG